MTNPTAAAERQEMNKADKIREALCDPQAPWYGSDLVPLVADYLDATEGERARMYNSFCHMRNLLKGYTNDADLATHAKRFAVNAIHAMENPLDALASLGGAEEASEPITEEWLRSVGFKPKRYQRETVLAMNFESYLGDSHWIEKCNHVGGEFVLCRFPDDYDDDMPPDRVYVTANTRADVRRLCEVLGIPLATEGK